MGQKWGSWFGELSPRFRCLTRRKLVDNGSVHSGKPQLVKELCLRQLIAIGVGSTIGAGVFVLVGTAAREHSGPSLTMSFFIAGIAAALSAFCYAELASRSPCAGSAYHYSYICIGEGVAWLIGWALILEYTIGGAAVARGISPNLALFFGGEDHLPAFLGRVTIPWLHIMVDPIAAMLVFIVTGLLCTGIKESSLVQAIVTSANVCAMIFVIIAGGYLGFRTGWAGYAAANGFFPYGINGMLAGSATVFFAYIGFDTVASTAEEVKNPRRDLPLGIGVTLFICCLLYMLVSAVIVGLVPYYALDPHTPISSAFSSNGMKWAGYVVTVGAVTALCSTLMGSMLPQPRVLMAMGRDGLLPPFFSDVNKSTHVPIKSTLITGIFAASLAFCMDVSQLAGMVSVGTLLAFTVVAVSILILRYVPPNDMFQPSPFQHTIDPVVSQSYAQENECEKSIHSIRSSGDAYEQCRGCMLDHNYGEVSATSPLVKKESCLGETMEQKRRRVAAVCITLVCIGVLILTSAASAEFMIFPVQLSLCIFGCLLLLCGLIALSLTKQDDGRHGFRRTGGFLCPFVPLLPVSCILINVYLLVNLSVGTWIRVSVWLLLGVLIYLFYGRHHSSLSSAVYVPNGCAEERHGSTSHSLA